MVMGKPAVDMTGQASWDLTRRSCWLTSPSKLLNTLRPETVSTVVEVWTAFADIYKVVNNWNPENDPKQFFMKAKQWISLFLSLNDKRKGYKRNSIPPYMHFMVTHILRLFELHKSVNIFTGQGVEKNDDMARGIILCKSNKWDSARDVLQQERCQWEPGDLVTLLERKFYCHIP